MRFIMGGLLGLSLIVGAARVGYANCAADDPTGAKVAAARQQVQTDCICDHTNPPAVNHGQYVKCAGGVAASRAALDSSDPNFLPKSCKGAVKKCAAHSTCGKPGFVTCCITKDTNNGPVTKCKTKKDATHCTDKQGIVGTCASCCDACPAPGTPGCQSPSGAFLN
jgi:hypothetical protein